ncbi:MAG: tRNA uridine-5-carboxymethylaminomethyl(34) synthesis GTPase MnmE [Parachlamydiaceae bacterium]|nr:tRNA uridine-5-carboxymethylaminomethyl(34) synthesis GTPase MnmE [Parachlamydiaceae bacterium]
MEFIHHPYQPNETIAAIATPPGEGGIAIIRISGKNAIDVAAKLFSGNVHSFKTHTLHLGTFHNLMFEPIDEVLLAVMLGKRSFTGENTVEIHCHGGSLVARKVLEAVLSTGIRAARPGEFSFKAFMNGKVDLTQAEAIQELICAKNEKALEAAGNQLRGKLSGKISYFQKELTPLVATLEAWIDFPEEGLEFTTMEELCEKLESICKDMQKLLDTFHNGKILHDGIALCLVGCPNVGKSSLMNALLDKERAIVSHIPGTTRDIVEDHLRLNGLNFKLLDTAGIREAVDLIECEGIRRSKEAMFGADLILFVLDASVGVTSEDLNLMELLPREKTIAIWNKTDLPDSQITSIDFPHTVHLSAKERNGLELLHKEIDTVVWKKGPPTREEILITTLRHKEALSAAIDSCRKVIQGLHLGTSPEFLTSDMRQMLKDLGIIIGVNVTETILSSIFSQFCIGK